MTGAGSVGAPYVGVGVAVAVDVEEGQHVDVHLVQQAGHGCVCAVGGESLQGATMQHEVVLLPFCCRCCVDIALPR